MVDRFKKLVISTVAETFDHLLSAFLKFPFYRYAGLDMMRHEHLSFLSSSLHFLSLPDPLSLYS